MSSLNQYTVNIVNCDELYVQGKKIQNLDIGTLTTYNQTYGVGIRTDYPRLTLDINGTDAMRIPIGTNAQRPLVARSGIFDDHPTLVNAANNRLEGCIRYNSSLALFEGWSTGNGQWENLANTSNFNISSNGNVGIGGINSNYKLYLNGNSYFNGNLGIGGYNSSYKLYLNGNSYFNGNVGIKTTGNPTQALDINGNLRLNGNLMMTGNKKLHIGRYNNNTPNMSDDACVYIGGGHNTSAMTKTLLKIADYNNDSATQKVVHFISENALDSTGGVPVGIGDYYFQAAANGGYHYYRGYLGIGMEPSSDYRINVDGTSKFTKGMLIDGSDDNNYGLEITSGIYYNDTTYRNYFQGSYGSGLNSGSYVYRYYYYYHTLYKRYTSFYTRTYGSTGKVSIKTAHGIHASKFIVNSDERIKTNIENVPDNLSLNIIRKLEAKYYNYIDIVNRSTIKQVGFLAQDVLKYIPEAVRFNKEFIPNEMRLVSTPVWTTFHDLSGNLKYKLTISDLEDPSGNTRYRFIISDDSDGINEIKKEIPSLENEPNSFVFDKKWNNVFIYGKEVDDFHVLDKAKIWAVAYSALQEVDRIQQREQTKLKEAESKIKNLENQLAGVLSRLSNLEKN